MRLQEYKNRKRDLYGELFDSTDLDAVDVRIREAYETRRRVRIQFSFGEAKTGTIGVTTGWKPCFLLMLRSNSIGSSWTIGPEDKVVAIQGRDKKYADIQ